MMEKLKVEFSGKEYEISLALTPFGVFVQQAWLLAEKEQDENGVLIPDVLLTKEETDNLFNDKEFIQAVQQKLGG